MLLDLETKRLIFAIKQNYYDTMAQEKYLSYAPNTSYSQYLDLLYQLFAFMVGHHHHPGQLGVADTFRLLDDPILAKKAEEVMPMLKADVLSRLAEMHGGPARAQEGYEALVGRLLKTVLEADGA